MFVWTTRERERGSQLKTVTLNPYVSALQQGC